MVFWDVAQTPEGLCLKQAQQSQTPVPDPAHDVRHFYWLTELLSAPSWDVNVVKPQGLTMGREKNKPSLGQEEFLPEVLLNSNKSKSHWNINMIKTGANPLSLQLFWLTNFLVNVFFWFSKWLVNALLPISASSNWFPPCKTGQKWLPEPSSFQIGKSVPSGNLKSRLTLMAQTPQRNIIWFPVLFFPISLMVWKAWVLSLERPSLGGILQILSWSNRSKMAKIFQAKSFTASAKCSVVFYPLCQGEEKRDKPWRRKVAR